MMPSIHSRYLAILVYTPGIPCVAHPTPQLTTPARIGFPVLGSGQTNGPPESPYI